MKRLIYLHAINLEGLSVVAQYIQLWLSVSISRDYKMSDNCFFRSFKEQYQDCFGCLWNTEQYRNAIIYREGRNQNIVEVYCPDKKLLLAPKNRLL